MNRFYMRVMISVLFIGLVTGGIVMAGELGSKEELDFAFEPQEAGDTAKPVPVKSPPKTSPQDTVDTNIAKRQLAQDGETLYSQGKFSDAITKWESALKLDPADAEIKNLVKDAQKKIAAKTVPKSAPSETNVKENSSTPEILKPASIQGGKELKSNDAGAVSGNKWFGLESGGEEIRSPRDMTRRIIGAKPAEIYSLNDCIAIAISNSIPMQIAEKSVKLADWRVLEARRNMGPTVTIAFEPYTGKVNERNYIGRKQYIEGQQPVFRGGELYYALRQAETNREITKIDRNKVRNELVLQVKKAYYILAKAKENLNLQRELSSDVGRIYQMVSDQFDAAVTSKLEYMNVGQQSNQIKYQLASADGDVEVAALILKQAMNIDPACNIDIQTNLAFNRIAVDYNLALTAAFNNRPEIISNTLMVQYYLYGTRIATAKSLPKVDLMGNWGLAHENYSPVDNAWGNTGFNGGGTGAGNPEFKLEEQWYAGIKTSVPIWGSTMEYSYTREQWVPVISAFQGTEAATNSWKLKVLDNLAQFSEKQLSIIDFDRARQELVKIQQDVTLEVKEQCFNYEKALIQLDTASSKVAYQASDLEFTKMKRGLDEATDSNVVDSMIKYSQERFGYVQSLSDCHIAIASINKAIGIEDYYKDE